MVEKFSFGKNWQRYLSLCDNRKSVKEARESLLKYLPGKEYKGKIFIDIGCGSGLFSLGAISLGCKKVYSLDIDLNSIKAANSLRDNAKHLLRDRILNWEVLVGDILDNRVAGMFKRKGDIVYSWGALHHTGQMWQAIKNAAEMTNNNGYFIIAIYNHTASSEFWLKIKQFYNRQNNFIRSLLVVVLFLERAVGRLLLFKNPLRKRRGMLVLTDIIDWLGGYPYEFACYGEIEEFICKLGFELIKRPTELPCGKNTKSSLWDKMRGKDTGCNEFVFKKIK